MSDGKDQREKRIASATLGFGVSLAAMIFSTQFFPIQHSYLYAWLLFGSGLAGMLISAWSWRRL